MHFNFIYNQLLYFMMLHSTAK